MVALGFLIKAYTIITFTVVLDEAWNIGNPRPYPMKEYALLQWEEDDFYKNIYGQSVLRPYRKTDSELKKAVRKKYWKEINMYYNTNEETGQTLRSSRNKSQTQEEIILDFFKNNPNLRLSPFEIQEILELNAPITSVRRAMTNLATNGDLRKTKLMKIGPYGKQVHTWRLNNEQT